MNSFSLCIPRSWVLKTELTKLVLNLVEGVVLQNENVVKLFFLLNVYSCPFLSRMTMELINSFAFDSSGIETILFFKDVFRFKKIFFGCRQIDLLDHFFWDLLFSLSWLQIYQV